MAAPPNRLFDMPGRSVHLRRTITAAPRARQVRHPRAKLGKSFCFFFQKEGFPFFFEKKNQKTFSI
jgi:hypothetical protein